MKSTISWVEVPGRKISAMPDCFSVGMSASGMIPPTRTVTSFMPLSWRSFISCGQMVLCAPERMERPITSTSSCTAAEAIISGVWRRPVYTTSMPASRRARAIIFAPRSWPSRPGLAINTRIFFSGIWSRFDLELADPFQEILNRNKDQRGDEEIEKNQADETKRPTVPGLWIVGSGFKYTFCGLEYGLKNRKRAIGSTVDALSLERRRG